MLFVYHELFSTHLLFQCFLLFFFFFFFFIFLVQNLGTKLSHLSLGMAKNLWIQLFGGTRLNGSEYGGTNSTAGLGLCPEFIPDYIYIIIYIYMPKSEESKRSFSNKANCKHDLQNLL